jgi:hypothetical protein
MGWQTLVTAVVVGACAAYALWAVLPAALRRRVALRLGRPAASAGGGACGGCSDCGSAPPAATGPPGEAVIRIVRRPPAP